MSIPDGVQSTADGVLAGAAISAPLWVKLLTNGLHLYVMVGGAVLLTLRIIKAIRGLRNNKQTGK